MHLLPFWQEDQHNYCPLKCNFFSFLWFFERPLILRLPAPVNVYIWDLCFTPEQNWCTIDRLPNVYTLLISNWVSINCWFKNCVNYYLLRNLHSVCHAPCTSLLPAVFLTHNISPQTPIIKAVEHPQTILCKIPLFPFPSLLYSPSIQTHR